MAHQGEIGGSSRGRPKTGGSPTRWLEVTIKAGRDHRQRAADLLLDLGCGGVITGVTEFGHPPTSDQETVRGFFPAGQAARWQRRIRQQLRRAELGPLQARVSFSYVDDQAWASCWRERFGPVRAGRRLVVVPPWQKAVGRKVAVIIEPGMAFGTGSHDTTRACLAALDKSLRERPVGRALDVGTGSGILAIAMAKLGVRRVIALDTDRAALASARGNLRRNRVAGRVHLSSQPLSALRGKLRALPLAVANIYAEVLAELEGDLWRVLQARGRFIASGILASQDPLFLEAFARKRWRPIERRRRGEWVTWTLEKLLPR